MSSDAHRPGWLSWVQQPLSHKTYHPLRCKRELPTDTPQSLKSRLHKRSLTTLSAIAMIVFNSTCLF
ncbi:MAG: hypothetical protein AAGD25_33730 [Cyanobacteria bacterium P01_F01_bin.150]